MRMMRRRARDAAETSTREAIRSVTAARRMVPLVGAVAAALIGLLGTAALTDPTPSRASDPRERPLTPVPEDTPQDYCDNLAPEVAEKELKAFDRATGKSVSFSTVEYCNQAARATPVEVFQGRTNVVPIYEVENGVVTVEFRKAIEQRNGDAVHFEVTDEVVAPDEIEISDEAGTITPGLLDSGTG